MSSRALKRWHRDATARLDELESVHAEATGTGPGRRWGTLQLNRSLFVALVAQFQQLCRDVHDEAVDVHVREANPHQAQVLHALLTQGRKLETSNPRTDHLGSDFGRLGLRLIVDLKEQGVQTQHRLERLDLLVDFRNAIGHGNEAEIDSITATGRIDATKQWFRRYRSAVHQLAITMDRVVAEKLAELLDVDRPW